MTDGINNDNEYKRKIYLTDREKYLLRNTRTILYVLIGFNFLFFIGFALGFYFSNEPYRIIFVIFLINMFLIGVLVIVINVLLSFSWNPKE